MKLLQGQREKEHLNKVEELNKERETLISANNK